MEGKVEYTYKQTLTRTGQVRFTTHVTLYKFTLKTYIPSKEEFG